MSAPKETSPTRRDYSRGGCRECKRRKIKCDETKPFCAHCTRLKKECTYPKVGEKVLRVSRRYLDENPTPPPMDSTPKDLNIKVYLGTEGFKKKKKPRRASDLSSSIKIEESPLPVSASPINTIINDTPSSFESFARDTPIPMTANSFPSDDIPTNAFANTTSLSDAGLYANDSPTSSIAWDNLYSHEDLNLLASDLNTIVNDIMFQSNFKNTLDSDFTRLEPLKMVGSSINPGDEIPKHIAVDFIKVNTGHERIYLEDFYHSFANQLLPFGAYDPAQKIYANPIRDVLMKYASQEPFLLAAILAQGAKTSYDKNHLQRDQEAYCSYLSTCLNLLGPALSRNRDKSVKNDLTSNIEAILLTVLLLTSANAANKQQGWRPHLKGAKDIILKATNSRIRQSKTLIICKVWFIDFEMLAGLSSPLGGTLKTNEELVSVVNIDDEYEQSVLRDYGLLRGNGFNIMFGYNHITTYLFRDLIKIFNLRRTCGDKFRAKDSLDYLRLLAGFYEQYNVVYLSQECISTTVTGDLCDVIFVQNENICISWMDLSQQAYSLAGIITILTEILGQPYYAVHIQDLCLNKQLIALVSFLKDCPGIPEQGIKNSVMMIQWPMLVAGINCMFEDEKYVLMKFFRISAQLGSGSAEIALKRIVRVWEKRDLGEDIDTEEENDLDVVLY
ncbi:uncharacterized protein CANTADRAFT_57394 [Suhomyces tanzawaensis NRRL Y-17324]|uniref:Zn(2)-C6 fungal-type domain-containing protein n=1 Tax=Suhomyces tanzawaensis NRRL Y-17324 TaxID=984487 RepID=A0A1E4SBK2_9ASCO|nr:uncharacterized protein CANTADRAFT_57394 [Suhomyces tanzawaensis NRRL Y-17324]ODV76865.1 hypothetical protein CANTADRAFT_57394 [Suhomyces tanzawaensis NRRL Y-17324]